VVINNPTQKQIVGKIGEDCVCKYLVNKGYKVIERNYLRKWGEIDIIAQRDKAIHFIEVKSVSREIHKDVTCGTSRYGKNDLYRAEDNLHPWKIKRLSRVIQSYLLEKGIDDGVDWQFDVATVLVDMSKRISRVTYIEDLVL
jgi:putative endonuclease